MQQYTVNDLFCGTGGMSIAFKQAGFKVNYACDFDKHCINSYNVNVGPEGVLADITTLTYKDIPKADVWTFGFPCQDLSCGGKQRNFIVKCIKCGKEFNILQGENTSCPKCGSTKIKSVTRSSCFFEVMRILQETKINLPNNLPKVILAENVPEIMYYSNNCIYEYNKLGYSCKFKTFNSKFWGVPQNRERVYIVGVQNNLEYFSFPNNNTIYKFPTEPSIPCKSLYPFLEKYVDKKYFIPYKYSKDTIEEFKNKNLKTKQGLPAYASDNSILSENTGVAIRLKDLPDEYSKGHISKRVYMTCGVFATLTTGAFEGIGRIFDTNLMCIRKLTPTEFGRLQGFPMHNWKFVTNDRNTYKMFGNAITVPLVKEIAISIYKFLEMRNL